MIQVLIGRTAFDNVIRAMTICGRVVIIGVQAGAYLIEINQDQLACITKAGEEWR